MKPSSFGLEALVDILLEADEELDESLSSESLEDSDSWGPSTSFFLSMERLLLSLQLPLLLLLVPLSLLVVPLSLLLVPLLLFGAPVLVALTVILSVSFCSTISPVLLSIIRRHSFTCGLLWPRNIVEEEPPKFGALIITCPFGCDSNTAGSSLTEAGLKSYLNV